MLLHYRDSKIEIPLGGYNLEKPQFTAEKTLCVFDIDQLLWMESGGGRYSIRQDAQKVVEQATEDFDEVVFWTANAFPNFPYSEFPQPAISIWGPSDITQDGMKKNLKILTGDLDRIIAFEDGERYFTPEERTIVVPCQADLRKAYESGVRKISRKRTR